MCIFPTDLLHDSFATRSLEGEYCGVCYSCVCMSYDNVHMVFIIIYLHKLMHV